MTYASNVRRLVILAAFLLLAGVAGMRAPAAAQNSSSQAPGAANEFYDSHFHLTNYIQQGITPREFLQIMGTRVGRSTLFGIPLQQQWSFANSGDFAPTYYLHSDAPLYYYSFTDAYIASVYRALTPAEQARFDPMITGFNPADMYGVDHIRRVLQTFPGVFTGIGEFSIHKEFVSAKVSGETASLTNPALDRILDFAAEVRPRRDPAQRHRHAVREDRCRAGLPDADEGAAQAPSERRDHLGARRPRPHRASGAGLGGGGGAEPRTRSRSSKRCWPIPRSSHVNFDISWDEVAKYAVASPESIARVAAMLNKYPGPVPVRDRHGGAGGAGAVLRACSTCGRRCGAC